MVNIVKNFPAGDKLRARLVRHIFLIAGAFGLIGLGIIIGKELDSLAQYEAGDVAKAIIKSGSQKHRKLLLEPPQSTNSAHDSGGEVISEEVSTDTIVTNSDEARTQDSVSRGSGQSSPLADYSMQSAAPEGSPVIAIVIDDMGLNRARSMEIMSLTGPLTVSLMTYARGLDELSLTARKAGHEVFAHLPMEPFDSYENPGPGALFTNMDESTIRLHISDNLDKWRGYVGINNHMGSKFTEDATLMLLVMEELKARGLMWLDSKTTADSAGKMAAAWVDVPFVERDVFLDNENSVSAILNQLEILEATAISRGYAIGIGHPYDSTIEALRQWLPTLHASGIFLVPVTEVLRRSHKPVKEVGARQLLD